MKIRILEIFGDLDIGDIWGFGYWRELESIGNIWKIGYFEIWILKIFRIFDIEMFGNKIH